MLDRKKTAKIILDRFLAGENTEQIAEDFDWFDFQIQDVVRQEFKKMIEKIKEKELVLKVSELNS